MMTAQVQSRVVSRMAWGAVIAGLFVATAIFMVMGALSTAISLSFGTQALFEVPLWILALSSVAMFAGGLTAAYLSAGETSVEAILHGVVLWGATTILLLFFVINGVSLYGSEMMLAQPDLFGSLSAKDAWWAVAGVLGSLLATVIGALMGVYRPAFLSRRHKTTCNL